MLLLKGGTFINIIVLYSSEQHRRQNLNIPQDALDFYNLEQIVKRFTVTSESSSFFQNNCYDALMNESSFERHRMLQFIGLELKSRFRNSLPLAHLPVQPEGSEFIPVTKDQLTNVNILPYTSPGMNAIAAVTNRNLREHSDS